MTDCFDDFLGCTILLPFLSGYLYSCTDNFPTIETHTEENHGDVCRNEKMKFVCPPGCEKRPNSAPWCAMSGSDKSPCRINGK